METVLESSYISSCLESLDYLLSDCKVSASRTTITIVCPDEDKFDELLERYGDFEDALKDANTKKLILKWAGGKADLPINKKIKKNVYD